ncbi:hypothetical protein BV25DRAFT_1803365 [Artomyces pyxidatus]|uniref:Uncharacterized protein n=1 Tax=Artomyces pyxidatus TaxID=48021 RepID=A0ACB8T2F9_9AGAM|nr:hypothetical protein BV25DRAFT_1803365 [Artomyces pyxidatus]
MVGHPGIYGDRFSMVKAARSSLKKGAKAQYYPLASGENERYNPGRPEKYNLNKLPIRTEKHYWEVLVQLSKAKTKAARTAITRDTGISRMPLCAFSQAFVHPSFFPLDPFHLFYENCMPFIWDLWVTISEPGEIMNIGTEKAKAFGALIPEAMATLPSAFCGRLRDPFLKRQSQYKIYEWMGLLHWYIIPIGIELGFDSRILTNFALFVKAIEFAMTIQSRSEDELMELHDTTVQFLEGYELLYVGKDPEKNSRCRLCMFQLTHVPLHIEWYGSIRIGSQSTIERAIGELGHKIRSKKEQFANAANLIFEDQLVTVTVLKFPFLLIKAGKTVKKLTMQEFKILKREILHSREYFEHVQLLCAFIEEPFNITIPLRRWGKYNLQNGNTVRSRLSEEKADHVPRSARYFEARLDDPKADPVFGEALAFYEVVEKQEVYVVYHQLVEVDIVFGIQWRGQWSDQISILPCSKIYSLIGIWCGKKVYILRKHPGLDLLSSTDKQGDGDDNDDEDDIDDEDDWLQ